MNNHNPPRWQLCFLLAYPFFAICQFLFLLCLCFWLPFFAFVVGQKQPTIKTFKKEFTGLLAFKNFRWWCWALTNDKRWYPEAYQWWPILSAADLRPGMKVRYNPVMVEYYVTLIVGEKVLIRSTESENDVLCNEHWVYYSELSIYK